MWLLAALMLFLLIGALVFGIISLIQATSLDTDRQVDSGGKSQDAVPEWGPFVFEPSKEESAKKIADQRTGFFSSNSIRIMLLSGAALLFFSAYLFVRSHWDQMPDPAKFAGLAFLTTALYSLGFFFRRRERVPGTSKTLLTLGLLLVPFNVAAANLWLFHGVMSSEACWAWGSLAMMAMAGLTHTAWNLAALRWLMGASFLSLLYFGVWSFGYGDQSRLLAVAGGSFLLALASLVLPTESHQKDMRGVACIAAFLVLAGLGYRGFFWRAPSQFLVAITLSLLSGVWAVLSRRDDPRWGYLAGAGLFGALVMLLHDFRIPAFKFGYGLIPAGFLCLLRAWTFEREGREALAKPYFALSQIALAASVILVFPTFRHPDADLLFPLLVILGGAAAAYAAGGALYRTGFFVGAGALVLLTGTWTVVWNTQLDFSIGVLFFASIGSLFLVLGALGSRSEKDFMGQPLTWLGFGTLSMAMALLAGRWGNEFFKTGVLIPALPMDQIRAGLWTGGLSVLAYGFLAVIKKRTAFLYPALLSATWVYVCILQSQGIRVDLTHISGIVVAGLALYYLLENLGHSSAARSFALWAEMAFVLIAGTAVIFQAPLGFLAAFFCALAFLPSIFRGRKDLTTGFIASLYLMHFLWFRLNFEPAGMLAWAEYGLYLIPVNCGVVFVRGLITWRRPEVSVTPFRVAALLGSIAALGLSWPDWNIAGQVFMANGALAFAVSRLFYRGRFDHVGGVLLLAGCEMFLRARGVTYLEAYTAPVAVYLLLIGFLHRARKDTRDFLYGAAMVIVYLPSSIQAMNETWQLHGVFLGVASFLVLLFGLHQRSRVLAFPSLLVLLVNGFFQSRQFFGTVPRWIYLGLAGLSLLSLGGLFEFKRDALLRMKEKVTGILEEWD